MTPLSSPDPHQRRPRRPSSRFRRSRWSRPHRCRIFRHQLQPYSSLDRHLASRSPSPSCPSSPTRPPVQPRRARRTRTVRPIRHTSLRRRKRSSATQVLYSTRNSVIRPARTCVVSSQSQENAELYSILYSGGLPRSDNITKYPPHIIALGYSTASRSSYAWSRLQGEKTWGASRRRCSRCNH